MQTKQEILDKYIPCQCWPAKDGGKVYNVSCPQHSQDPETAMDEHAEIEAISFAEWVAKEGWYYNKIQRWSNRNEKSENLIEVLGNTKSTSELFQLFKTQQTKHHE